MGAKAREYLAKAEECERRAADAKDPETRHGFAELARQWRDLARQRSVMDEGR